MNSSDEEQIASEALAILGMAHQIEPSSSRFTGFDLSSAYKVSRLITQGSPLHDQAGKRGQRENY